MATVAYTPRITKITPEVSSVGPFLVGFRLFDSDGLKIYVDGVEMAPSAYSIDATFVDGYDDTASLKFTSPANIGSRITIEGAMKPERQKDYVPTDPSVLQKVNVELARLWTCLIEQSQRGSGSLRVDMDIAPWDPETGRVPVWNGTGFENGPNALDLANAGEYAEMARQAYELTIATGSFTIADVTALKNSTFTFPPGSTVLTRAERFSFKVSSGADRVDLVTAGGINLTIIEGDLTAFGGGDKAQQLVNIGGGLVDIATDRAGGLVVKSGLELRGKPSTYIKQTAFSAYGSFINSRPVGDPVPLASKDVLLVGLNLDGSAFPEPRYVKVVFAVNFVVIVEGQEITRTKLRFDPIAVPESADLRGLCVTMCEGDGAYGLRFISTYDPATREAVFNTGFPLSPNVGDTAAIGWNDNAIGIIGGCERIRIIDCFAKNWPAEKMVPGAGGAKWVNFESGLTDGLILGGGCENMGTAVFFQGVPETFAAPNGSLQRAVGARAIGFHAKNVGSLLTFAGLVSGEKPSGDANINLSIASNITYENAGHSPWRLVGTDQQKSGIINLLQANNVLVSNVHGRNDPGHGSAPTDWPGRVGYGLSGPIGAMVWGYGRNISINSFHHHGNVDTVVHVGRSRALGNDAGPGLVGNCYGWNLTQINLHGTAKYALRLDGTPSYRPPPAEFTGRIEIVVNALTDGICEPGALADYDYITLDVTQRTTGRRVIGTPKQILAAGNSFANFTQGLADLRPKRGAIYAIADDTFVKIKPPMQSGFVTFRTAGNASGASQNFGRVAFSIGGAAVAEIAYGTLAVGTTALTAGTADGVDGQWNVHAVLNDAIYIKNRRGAGNRSIEVWFD